MEIKKEKVYIIMQIMKNIVDMKVIGKIMLDMEKEFCIIKMDLKK